MSSTWTNWGGNQRVVPARVVDAADADEIAAAVRSAAEAGQRLKVVGSGHSFTGIAAPDGSQLRLTRLRGVTEVDRDRCRVRVLAGTPLHELNPVLWDLGMAMPNLGDIDRQTLSGAISTGTHGTGAALQGLAASVVGATLVTGDGSMLRVDDSTNADLLPAVRIGLGALGVLVDLDLQLTSAFRLRAVERPEPLDAVLERVQSIALQHRHFELYWFPHTDRVLTKRNDQVADGDPGRPLPRWRERLDDEVLSNTVFEGVNRLVAWRSGLAPRVNQVSARALSAREFTDRSYRVFCSKRDVRFVESEYAVPRDALVPVLVALRAWVDANDENVPFPVEVRFAAADDVWLSTAYHRDSAYVAVHQYHRMDGSRYFAAFEAIAREYDGRPHWGKLHTLGADDLRALYPRFDEFVAVRDRLDPARVFANPYLDRVLGA